MTEYEKFVEFSWLWLRPGHLRHASRHAKVVGCDVHVDSLDKLFKAKVRKKPPFFFLR